MKPEISWPWEKSRSYGELAYKLYISVFYDSDMCVCVFPEKNEFVIHDLVDGVMKRMQFPDGYLKLEEKKAYVELMLRLGVWDELLEDI